MTRTKKVADFSRPVDYTSYVYLALLAFFANAVQLISASIASQNKEHKLCIDGLTGTFNVTRNAELCNFSFSYRGIQTQGLCSWCPPYVPTPHPSRRPRIKSTGSPVRPLTNNPTPKPSPGPTKAKVTKRPTRPPHPTPKPTHRPTCMPAIGVSSSSLGQQLALSNMVQAHSPSRPLLPGLMRVMVEGAFKYCVLSIVSKNIYQLPATCMFAPISSINGTVSGYYIPPEFYSAELTSGHSDFDQEGSYPGISAAFYPEEFLGPNPMAYNYAYVVASAPISFINEMSAIDQSASQALLAYVEDAEATVAPTPKPA